jgi:hypothetical protein
MLMRYAIRPLVSISLLVTALGLGLWALAQSGDYFQNYPGGFTEAIYQITTEQLEDPIELSWQVEPASDDKLTVTTSSVVTARREELELGVINGVAQAQLIIQGEAVRALLENRGLLAPHTTFILPGGARFTAAARENIAGVPVLCGLLTEPDKPHQRTLLAITQNLAVPFPPFIQLEEERPGGQITSSLEVCTSLLSLIQSTHSYEVLFRLELTHFERRE